MYHPLASIKHLEKEWITEQKQKFEYEKIMYDTNKERLNKLELFIFRDNIYNLNITSN